MSRRWLVLGTLLGGALIALSFAVWSISSARRLRSELEQAEQEIEGGYFHTAKERLIRLEASWPGQAEVAYRLGLCERARGNPDAALEAWRRVPASSPFFLQANLARGRLAMENGRFSETEEAFLAIASNPSPEAAQARHTLAFVMGQEGRIDEALDWIEHLWRDVRPSDFNERLSLLHDHIALDFETFPIEGNLAVIERRAAAKDDPRVWLSRAYLAISTGKLNEAEKWLDACSKHAPNDPVVWRARLELARAEDRVDRVREALGHLPTGSLRPGRIAELRVWLAAHRHDDKAERAALERLIEIDPGNTTALGRLAQLVNKDGQAERGRELLKRKAKLDLAKEQYNSYFTANRFVRDALEMARLAEMIGRDFEARAFATMAAQKDPNNKEAAALVARLSRREPPRSKSDKAMVQLLGEAFSSLHPGSDAQSVRADVVIPRFDDDSKTAGLAAFTFDNGTTPIHQLPETSGGGVALLDYDGDGWLDVYAVQGGPFPDGPFTGDRLFRNRGDGTFEDVTEKSRIAEMTRGYGNAVAVGDYDNDGHPDLFITRWRSYALYRNRGDGTFEDATQSGGLGGDRDWPTSAAFADLDNDGDLDLYVCHYGTWDAHNPIHCKDPSGKIFITCNPREIQPMPDHLFRNDRGKFVDVTKESGVLEHDGRGLGVVIADLDDDGRLDICVANDSSANFLFHNLGGLRFEEVASSAAFDANGEGRHQAGMGIACGDLDGDGLPDIVVTNFYDESTTFYQNQGSLFFSDRSAAIGLKAPSRYRLGFGVAMFDVNNDGRADLLTANGHVHDMSPLFPFAMPAQLFVGGADGKLTEVTDQAGPAVGLPHLGRGLAAGDLDNDGRVDALLVSQNEPLVKLRNNTTGVGHFVTIQLEGTKSNRDGVGAKLTLQSGGRKQVAQRSGGGSFASAADPRIHFGLAENVRVDSVEIRWPSGQVDQHKNLAADAGYLIREGEPTAKRLPRFSRQSHSSATPSEAASASPGRAP